MSPGEGLKSIVDSCEQKRDCFLSNLYSSLMGVRFYIEFSVFLICVCALSSLASGLDTLTASQYIKDPDALISENNMFTL